MKSTIYTAAAAANNGVTGRLGSEQGRWSLEKARNRYIIRIVLAQD